MMTSAFEYAVLCTDYYDDTLATKMTIKQLSRSTLPYPKAQPRRRVLKTSLRNFLPVKRHRGEPGHFLPVYY